MFKVTVLYNHPADAEAFEKYYVETHTPIAKKIPTLTRMELTKFVDGPAGKPAYYRMAELCFASAENIQSALSSPEGQAAVNDLSNFATGGATFIIGVYHTEDI